MDKHHDRGASQERTILFVCTGNICRSPLAAGIFNQLIGGVSSGSIKAYSAGIHAVVDAPADPIVCEIAAAANIDLLGHRARQIDVRDFIEFEHVIALDLYHYDFLIATQPKAATATISLLLNHAKHVRTKEVPDPYGQPRRVFEKSARLIEEGIRGLLSMLSDS